MTDNDQQQPSDPARPQTAHAVSERNFSRRGLIGASTAVALSAAIAPGAARAQDQAPAASSYTGPVKRLQLAHPRAGISEQDFHDHWRHPHATMVRDMRANRRYVQHHRIASKSFKDSDSTYLALAEVWVDSLAASDQSNDPHFIQYVQPDEPKFVDPSKHIITRVVEDVVQAHRRMIQPDGSFGDLYWSDNDANTYVTLTQFVRDRSIDWTQEESLALSRRLGTFRQIINRSLEPNSQMSVIRQFFWPTLTIFETAVATNREAFEALRQTPSSMLFLARAERVF